MSTPNALTSTCRCGAKLTPSTQNKAPTLCTASAILFTSWIVPRMLLTCVHYTNTTFSLSNGLRFSAVSFNPSSFDDSHHLMVRLRRLAMKSQGLTLVSCSIFERMISLPELKERDWEMLTKSCVVDAPSTVIY